jgi:hypothetical protein
MPEMHRGFELKLEPSYPLTNCNYRPELLSILLHILKLSSSTDEPHKKKFFQYHTTWWQERRYCGLSLPTISPCY